MAILFWFYKEPKICENRLKFLRKYNPETKIFGLYGGDQAEAKKYEKLLRKYLDNFYVSPHKNRHWKWVNGDLMILDWYKRRGKNLAWDSLAVVQWDMLILTNLKKYFNGIKKYQIFLSGLRLLTKEIEKKWMWTRKGNKHRKNYLNFIDYIEKEYNFKRPAFCCLFIFQIFPKIFFEKYLKVKNKRVGMLEYKVPVYAKIFKTSFYRKNIGVGWLKNAGKYPLNAVNKIREESYIRKELRKKNGWRIFHPVHQIWK